MRGLKQSFVAAKTLQKTKYQRPLSMENRELHGDPMHNNWCISYTLCLVHRNLRAVLGQYELFTDRNTRDDLAWTIGNGDPMHGVCTPHSIPHAWKQ